MPSLCACGGYTNQGWESRTLSGKHAPKKQKCESWFLRNRPTSSQSIPLRLVPRLYCGRPLTKLPTVGRRRRGSTNGRRGKRPFVRSGNCSTILYLGAQFNAEVTKNWKIPSKAITAQNSQPLSCLCLNLTSKHKQANSTQDLPRGMDDISK